MACESPIPVVTTTITSVTMAIAWGSVANTTGYVVEYKVNDPAVGSWTTLPSQTTTSTVITSLSPSTEYLIRVKATCEDLSFCYSVTIINSTL